MKKIVALLMALVMALGLCGAYAEDDVVLASAYNGEVTVKLSEVSCLDSLFVRDRGQAPGAGSGKSGGDVCPADDLAQSRFLQILGSLVGLQKSPQGCTAEDVPGTGGVRNPKVGQSRLPAPGGAVVKIAAIAAAGHEDQLQPIVTAQNFEFSSTRSARIFFWPRSYC